MFNKKTESGYTESLPGIRQKTLVYGDKTLMTEFILAKGRNLPLHAHPYEQTGYLVKGHLRLKMGGEVFDAHEGDSWTIPMNIEHGAEIVANSVAIEVFSPARKDYLPKQ
ncbi:MAG: cupin domain-containing protein [Lentisphaerota bacterium]